MSTVSTALRLGATLTLGLGVLAAAPAVRAQQVVPASSEIAFVSKQMGVAVEGKFKKWSAQITLDPKKPEAGKVAFTIDTGSASFGVPETDAEVGKAPWFNAAKFPQASFTSSAIKALGGGRFEVRGKLTVKGVAQDAVVPVAVTQSGAASTATGAFTIKRLDFKIGEGEWADTSMVANDVQVKFKLALTGLAPL
ncbi:YceI family protein [Pseudaquabacterium rugosum]|jgi:polyisoprenoid-binding protein YceI|uniref:YceI family protein n=1 Tax=Pseudaquabacterium rugosum TaxID=2984194 RepID=A0ABU9B989_9BURK